MKISVIWDVMLFSLVQVYQFFRGFYCQHLSEHACPVFIFVVVRTLNTAGFLQFTRQICLFKFLDDLGKEHKGELACPVTEAAVYTVCSFTHEKICRNKFTTIAHIWLIKLACHHWCIPCTPVWNHPWHHSLIQLQIWWWHGTKSAILRCTVSGTYQFGSTC